MGSLCGAELSLQNDDFYQKQISKFDLGKFQNEANKKSLFGKLVYEFSKKNQIENKYEGYIYTSCISFYKGTVGQSQIKPKGAGILIINKNNYEIKFQGNWQNGLPKDGVMETVIDPNPEKNEKIVIQKLQRSKIKIKTTKYQYEGEIALDKEKNQYIIHGKGIMKFKNGGQYNGSWVNGQMSGLGTYKWATGQMFIGEYLHGKKLEGRYYYKNKISQYSKFENGQKVGQSIMYDPNDKEYQNIDEK